MDGTSSGSWCEPSATPSTDSFRPAVSLLTGEKHNEDVISRMMMIMRTMMRIIRISRILRMMKIKIQMKRTNSDLQYKY